MLVNALWLCGEGPRRSLILLALEDVTERQQAAIAEFSDDAITGIDLTGKLMSWNKGAERLYGYAAEEIIGRPYGVDLPGRADELPRYLNQLRGGRKSSVMKRRNSQ